MAFQEIGKKVTQLELWFPPFMVAFNIQSNAKKKTRRMLALMIYRELRPLFKSLAEARIEHKDGDPSHLMGKVRPISVAHTPRLSNPLERLGFRIRMKRLNTGLTQGDLAKLTGLNRSHVGKIENGKCKPRPETLKRVYAALSVSEKQHEKQSLS